MAMQLCDGNREARLLSEKLLAVTKGLGVVLLHLPVGKKFVWFGLV